MLTSEKLSTARVVKLAIVGMDVVLGNIDGLSEFEQNIYSANPAESRMSGPMDEHLLLNKVIERALGGGAEIASERTAGLFSFGSAFASGETRADLTDLPNFGECADLSLQGNHLAAGLMRAADLLESGSADVVVLGAVSRGEDFQPLVEKSGTRMNTRQPDQRTLGFERDVDGWTWGEGAAAVVLMGYEAAAAAGKRIYAVVDALAWVLKDAREPKATIFPTFLNSGTIQQSCELAFAAGEWGPEDVGYLEVLGSGFAPVDAAEIGGITRAYRREGTGLSCALGSAQLHSGYVFNTAGLAGLIRTAVCLYQRWIPGTPAWTGPKKPELWAQTPFYVSAETRTWFLRRDEKRRKAALNAIGWDGSCTHVLLSEEASQKTHTNRILSQAPFFLFPVAGNDPADVANGLRRLKETLTTSSDLRQAARDNYAVFQQAQNCATTAAIVGHDTEEVLREIEFGLRDIPAAFEKKKVWQTPQGSFLTSEPVGRQGSVAFVYPGAFNSYLGLGRELFILFPELYERAIELSANLGVTLQEEMLYPRSLEALSKEQVGEREAMLNEDAIAMITSGSMIAVFFTMILQDVFKIKAESAFGYSLGEIAMLFGTGVWAEADATRDKLHTSELFRTRLSGPQNAVRENWGLNGTPSEGLWSNYFLMAPSEVVREAVRSEKHVYLTHVNTPRQVVIGGDPEGCKRVIAALKCTSLKAPFDFALHCDAMRSEYAALTELHTIPVAKKVDMKLYSAANNQALPFDSVKIGESLALMLCSCLDFPALVHKAYADGARVFIELGANANCSKWIDDTLKGQPALAVSINRKGADDAASIVRMLAKLVSHQAPVDLGALYR